MSQLIQPSDLYSQFQWSRLITLGQIFWDARQWVAENARVDLGDTACGVGLRAWEHSKFKVTKAASREHAEWLGIIDAGAEFKFRIGAMPVRFFRGDIEEPVPAKYAKADKVERGQMEIAFSESRQEAIDGSFRVMVEADHLGYPRSVNLVQVDALGATVRFWEIPRADDGTGIAPIVTPQTPVVLPDLLVESHEEAEDRERIRAEQERLENERKQRERETIDHKGA